MKDRKKNPFYMTKLANCILLFSLFAHNTYANLHAPSLIYMRCNAQIFFCCNNSTFWPTSEWVNYYTHASCSHPLAVPSSKCNANSKIFGFNISLFDVCFGLGFGTPFFTDGITAKIFKLNHNKQKQLAQMTHKDLRKNTTKS